LPIYSVSLSFLVIEIRPEHGTIKRKRQRCEATRGLKRPSSSLDRGAARLSSRIAKISCSRSLAEQNRRRCTANCTDFQPTLSVKWNQRGMHDGCCGGCSRSTRLQTQHPDQCFSSSAIFPAGPQPTAAASTFLLRFSGLGKCRVSTLAYKLASN